MRGYDSIEDVDDLAADIEGEIVDADSSRLQIRDRLTRYTNTSPEITGGDLDGGWETAELNGEELAGGSNLTPDQNVVEELGEALGLTYEDDEELWCGVKQRERDHHRWELNPESSEDWSERRKR